MNSKQLRGVVESDYKEFHENNITGLKIAQEEIVWLLNRGYSLKSALNFVANHYQLSARQRNAIMRSVCSEKELQNRLGKLLQYEDLKGADIHIDGFNIIITTEVLLSGGTAFQCIDGTIRDIAGLRGTYHIIDKTTEALDLIGKILEKAKVNSVHFYLDKPVSNSGKLKMKILEQSNQWQFQTNVFIVDNPDVCLSEMSHVVTSDGIILDKCISWINLSEIMLKEIQKQDQKTNVICMNI